MTMSIFKAQPISLLTMFIFLIAVSGCDWQSHERKKERAAQKSALIQKQNIDHFHANKEKIITALKTDLSSKDFQSVISTSSKYLASGDAELNELYIAANDKQKTEKTKSLIAALKKIPVKEFTKNKDLYEQLVILHPDNKKYKNKVTFYTKKLADATTAVVNEQARLREIANQFNGIGDHLALRRYIKSTMHNPDSYEHVKTLYGDKGDYLIVQTTIRGSNAFSGIVMSTITAKVSIDGYILEIIK